MPCCSSSPCPSRLCEPFAFSPAPVVLILPLHLPLPMAFSHALPLAAPVVLVVSLLLPLTLFCFPCHCRRTWAFGPANLQNVDVQARAMQVCSCSTPVQSCCTDMLERTSVDISPSAQGIIIIDDLQVPPCLVRCPIRLSSICQRGVTSCLPSKTHKGCGARPHQCFVALVLLRQERSLMSIHNRAAATGCLVLRVLHPYDHHLQNLRTLLLPHQPRHPPRHRHQPLLHQQPRAHQHRCSRRTSRSAWTSLRWLSTIQCIRIGCQALPRRCPRW